MCCNRFCCFCSCCYVPRTASS